MESSSGSRSVDHVSIGNKIGTTLQYNKNEIKVALPIILGLGMVLVTAVGLAAFGNHQGWWSTGTFAKGIFTHITSVDATVMLALGGCLASILLAAGTGLGKKHLAVTKTIYGLNELKEIGINSEDQEPPLPKINWSKKDPFFKEPLWKNYVLLYIPQNFSLDTGNDVFNKIGDEQGIDVESVNHSFMHDQKDLNWKHGWVLVSKKQAPKTLGKTYTEVEQMIGQNESYRITTYFEIISLILMARKRTGKRLLKACDSRNILEVRFGKEHVSTAYVKAISARDGNRGHHICEILSLSLNNRRGGSRDSEGAFVARDLD